MTDTISPIPVVTAADVRRAVLDEIGLVVRDVTFHRAETGTRWAAVDANGNPVGGVVVIHKTTDGSSITLSAEVYVETAVPCGSTVSGS